MTTVYTNIKDVPLDPYTTPDGIDRPDDEKAPRSLATSLSLAPSSSASVIVIPFHRVLQQGSRGRDVIGAKRAVWNANGLKIPTHATTLFGKSAVTQLRKFQKSHKLAVDGVLGETTLKKLAPFFDGYAFLLYVGYPPPHTKAQEMRNRFIAYALWGYNNRANIHYQQARPMDRLNDLQHLPIWDDCSEFYTKACKYAGMANPNTGTHRFDGSGWTGTIAVHGKLVASAVQAEIGDAFLYGAGPNFGHVAGYIGHGRVVSMGSEPGPTLVAWDYRSDFGEIRRFI